MAGLNAGLHSANGGDGLFRLAALLGGPRRQSASFQPPRLLHVRPALAQQQATQVAAQQTEIQKRFEAEARK